MARPHGEGTLAIESRRREFIVALGSAATWPLAARAQWGTSAQETKRYRIGFLFAGTIALRPQAQEFWRKLQELGYIEGKNFIAEIREAGGNFDRLPKLASEIVDTHPDVIVAVTPPSIAAAKMATQTIPIVMAISPDPVGLGFVKSLARPSGNVTGSCSLQVELTAKRVQLIKEIIPELSVLGMLWNEKEPTHPPQVELAEQATSSLGISLRLFPARTLEELKPALNKVVEEHVGALFVLGDALFFDRRADIVAFSLTNRVLTFHTWPDEAVDGAVAAYGAELADEYRRAAPYVAKILAGAAPADLPVEQATRFQFVLNMKTAKAIGLKIPDATLLRADRVID
jgi:putative tryptophan/tyrosine transport system substrate-binding protein